MFVVNGTNSDGGRDAFRRSKVANTTFEKGSTLREIGEVTFSHSVLLAAFIVPSSVEIIGDWFWKLLQDVINHVRRAFEAEENLRTGFLWLAAQLNHNSSIN
jgi:hypothetical protein